MKKLNPNLTFEEKVKRVAQKATFDVSYLPGIVESMDKYKAQLKDYKITCYGPTKAIAVDNARMNLEALFLSSTKEFERFLKG